MSGQEPLGDANRLGALRALAILDTPPERDYDDLAAMAARATGSRVAAVNLVDADRHFTKAIVGVAEAQGSSLPNDLSLCAATVREPGGQLTIADARGDERWRDHPAVTGQDGVGFYMGAAIVVDGERVGVVCAFGPEPREVTAQQRRELRDLADQAAAQMRLRRRTGRPPA